MKANKELEISELNKLNKEELEIKMLKLNKIQLSRIESMSYKYFIGKCIPIINRINSKDVLSRINEQKEKDIIIKNLQHIIDLFIRMDGTSSVLDIEHEMDILLNIRKEYYDLSEALHGYIIESSYIKELIDYYTIKKIEKKEDIHTNVDSNMEINLLLDRVVALLSSNKINHYTYIDIISNILAILPFRMSKSKYFDVLHDTMVRNLEHYSVSVAEDWIEEYKKVFDGSLHNNYGIIFDNYFTQIQRFKNNSIKSLDLKELDYMVKDVVYLSKEMQDIRGIIIDMGILVNRLIVILLNKSNTSFKHGREILSIFKKWEDGIDEKSAQFLMEESKKELQDMEKQLSKDANNLELLSTEIFKRENTLDKGLNQEMIDTRKVLTYFNDMKFNKHETLFPKVEEKISKNYLEQLVDNLIQYINRSIVSMGGMERKIRMRRLLATLELPFENIEEFLSHMKYSLDSRVVSKGEILFTIDTLNYWLNQLKKDIEI